MIYDKSGVIHSRRHQISQQPHVTLPLNPELFLNYFFNPAVGVGSTGEIPVLAGGAVIGAGVGGVSINHPGVAANTALAANAGNILPLKEATVLIHLAKQNKATGGEFGILAAVADNTRCGAHIPFTDNTVYFDFGGSSEGTTRLSKSGLAVFNNIWAFTTGPRGMEIWQDGVLVAANSGNPTRTATTSPWGVGGNNSIGVSSLLDCFAIGVSSKQLQQSLIARLTQSPQSMWQMLYAPQYRRVVIAASAAAAATGGGTETLQPIQETSAGKVGAVNTFGTETLKAITASAAGTAQLLPVGSATDTLKAITETAAGAIGLKSATDIETLKPITAAATGVVVSAADAGYGSATLKAITETSTGKIGAVTGAADVLRAVVMQASGQIGLIGSAIETLQPIQGFATGISAAPAIQPAQQGGAPAWWGYEGFDGTQRPWWYRDLKDKARELERLRLLRIELGILPKPKARKIARVVRETEDFADEYPTPARADEYMARADAVFDKVQKLIDDLQEQDDEKMIAELSKKFFFDRKEQWLRQ